MIEREKIYRIIMLLFLFVACSCLLVGCKKKTQRKAGRSFYYWKSTFNLSAAETEWLSALKIEKVYIKLFDVDWDDISKKPVALAKMLLPEKLPVNITLVPVVFITNETIAHCEPAGVDSLAENITALVQSILNNTAVLPFYEIQIDCDWTAGTKEKYFQLLRTLQQQALFNNKKLSVTIRLHQVKFMEQTGIPPADKGLLMCYNMVNLVQPQVENSIIDPDEFKKYAGNLERYPLPLDIGLPVFNWLVWFHHQKFKGLIHSGDTNLVSVAKENILFAQDTVINGYTFEKGDWLRYESSPLSSILEVSQLLQSKLPSRETTIILYHLDEKNLSQYKPQELDDIFSVFH